jgi:hypothetical protein
MSWTRTDTLIERFAIDLVRSDHVLVSCIIFSSNGGNVVNGVEVAATVSLSSSLTDDGEADDMTDN